MFFWDQPVNIYFLRNFFFFHIGFCLSSKLDYTNMDFPKLDWNYALRLFFDQAVNIYFFQKRFLCSRRYRCKCLLPRPPTWAKWLMHGRICDRWDGCDDGKPAVVSFRAGSFLANDSIILVFGIPPYAWRQLHKPDREIKNAPAP